MRIWVKICGVTRVADAAAAVASGADALGVNFHPASKRFCDVESARRIVRCVESDAVVYGVFVDRTREEIEEIVAATGITGIQLHGNEAPELCTGWSLPVIRALPVRTRGQLADAVRGARDAGEAVRLLLDSPSGGGSGRRFDYDVVADTVLKDVIVAGGLRPDNIAEIVSDLRPWGVDTAGGVESSAGVKDVNLIKEFIDNARSA